MKTHALLLLGLLLTALFCALLLPSGRDSNPGAEASTYHGDVSGDGSRSSGLLGSSLCSAFSSGFIDVWIETDYDFDGDAITIGIIERVPANFSNATIPVAQGTQAGEFRSSISVPTPFRVTHAAARHGSEFYLAGAPYTTRDSEQVDASRTVILLVQLNKVVGAPHFERSSVGSAPIGQSMPPSQLSITLPGGEYISPPKRGVPRTFTTKLVGTFALACQDLAVDPEGRYLVVLDSLSSAILQVDLVNLLAAPQVIATSQQYPGLALGNELNFARLAIDGGKRLRVRCAGDSRVILPDANNDGVFETAVQLTEVEYESAGYNLLSAWVENYVHYTMNGLIP